MAFDAESAKKGRKCLQTLFGLLGWKPMTSHEKVSMSNYSSMHFIH